MILIGFSGLARAKFCSITAHNTFRQSVRERAVATHVVLDSHVACCSDLLLTDNWLLMRTSYSEDDLLIFKD